MKILNLRFKNINSLKGEWEIDFENKDYLFDGIFSITGPTGSGKTTVLDAISLALYGETPRLKTISSNENEIMNKNSGICFSELVFSTTKGKYRVYWEQHRANNKPTTALQSPKHELYDHKTDAVIANKIKQVSKNIEEITQMNFQQFTRTVLLAQGDFDVFLKSKENEKADILEKITGTEIYSRISKRVFQKNKYENENLDRLNKQKETIEILNKDEIKELKREKLKLNKNSDRVQYKQELINRWTSWLVRINIINNNLEKINKEKFSLDKEEENSKDKISKYNNAKKGKDIEPIFVKVTELKKENTEIEEKIIKLTNNLHKINKENKTLKECEIKLKKEIYKEKNNKENQDDIIKQVREIITNIKAKVEVVDKLKKRKDEIEINIKNLKTNIENNKKEIENKNKEKDELQKYTKENTEDKYIKEKLSGLKNSFNTFKDKSNILIKKEETIVDLDKNINIQLKNKEKINEKYKLLELEINRLRVNITKSENEILLILDNKDLSYFENNLDLLSNNKANYNKLSDLWISIAKLKTILSENNNKLLIYNKDKDKQSELLPEKKENLKILENLIDELDENIKYSIAFNKLEEHRKNLKKGEPCPLCGSTEHPYESKEKSDLSEKQDKLKQTKDSKKKFEKELAKIENEIIKIQSDINNISELVKSQENEKQANVKNFNKICSTLDLPSFNEFSETLLNTKVKENLESLNKAKDIKKNVAKLSKDKDNFIKSLISSKEDFSKIEKDKLNTVNKINSYREDLKRVKDEILNINTKINLIKSNIIEIISIYKYRDFTIENIERIYTELSKRRDIFEEKSKKQEELKNEIELLFVKVTNFEGNIIELTKNNNKIIDSFNKENKILTSLRDEKYNLFGEKDPDIAEKELENSIKQAETNYEKKITELSKNNDELTKITTNIDTSNTQKNKISESLKENEKIFNEKLSISEFKDVVEFSSSRLSNKLFKEYEELKTLLRDKENDLKTRKKQKQKELDIEIELNYTKKDIGTLNNKKKSNITAIESINNKLSIINHKFLSNSENKVKYQDLIEKVVNQKIECKRWNLLNSLIGTQNGQKFQKFAQGLTFEIMIQYANDQLCKMSDRYILIHSKEKSLELDIIDNYQGGEIRSIKNLSGGESFIVSLTLSLGLANMVSNNIRVDSLFLDEGFGTLDEDSLDLALSTLSTLKHEGKLIGVISHIQALKDRIPCQITVEPLSGGVSKISGPGVKKIIEKK